MERERANHYRPSRATSSGPSALHGAPAIWGWRHRGPHAISAIGGWGFAPDSQATWGPRCQSPRR
eukprot:4447223-Alexandrium_andersonii.AAC.1